MTIAGTCEFSHSWPCSLPRPCLPVCFHGTKQRHGTKQSLRGPRTRLAGSSHATTDQSFISCSPAHLSTTSRDLARSLALLTSFPTPPKVALQAGSLRQNTA